MKGHMKKTKNDLLYLLMFVSWKNGFADAAQSYRETKSVRNSNHRIKRLQKFSYSIKHLLEGLV